MKESKLSRLKLLEGKVFKTSTDLYSYTGLLTGKAILNKKDNKEVIFEIQGVKNYTLRGEIVKYGFIRIKGIKRGKIKFSTQSY